MKQQMCLSEAWEKFWLDDTARIYLDGREVAVIYAGSIGTVYDGVWRVEFDDQPEYTKPVVVDQYALVTVETPDVQPDDTSSEETDNVVGGETIKFDPVELNDIQFAHRAAAALQRRVNRLIEEINMIPGVTCSGSVSVSIEMGG